MIVKKNVYYYTELFIFNSIFNLKYKENVKRKMKKNNCFKKENNFIYLSLFPPKPFANKM